MEGKTILVVDDEFRMRKLVKDFLQKEDCNVLEAGDGEEAIKVFYENNLDVYIARNKKSGCWSCHFKAIKNG